MIKYILSLLFFLSPYTVYSQEFTRTQLDSILNVYTSLRETIPTENLVKKIEDEPSFRKCGTGLVSQIKNNLEYYSDDQQLFISKILDRPVLPNSFLSPGGFFRIHYSNSGTDAVQYDINLLALALD